MNAGGILNPSNGGNITWLILNSNAVERVLEEVSDQEVVEVPADNEEENQPEANVTAKGEEDLIRLTPPASGGSIDSPLTITGEARGYWYFEATFPVVLTNWDGLIIAEGYAEAQSSWMTENYVPFVAELTFTSPYRSGDPAFMERGTLILQKANASGLPERDDALEINVKFSPAP